MLSTLQGLATIVAVVLVGYLVARARLLPASATQMLSQLVFFIATPALLLLTLAEADLGVVLSTGLAVTALSSTTAAVLFFLMARLWWKRPLGTVVIGSLASSYVNAGNLGIPLAVYVFGDAAYVATVMLWQITVLGTIAFVILDVEESGRRPSWRRVLMQPVRNPVILGSAVGLVLAALHVRLPEVIHAPIELIAGIAVPGALLAYGMSLRGAPLPGKGSGKRDVGTILVIKELIMPALAFVLARFVFGLTGVPLLAATMTAALPTAQNVFIYAVRYQRAIPLARDAVSTTTAACMPVLVGIAALLS